MRAMTTDTQGLSLGISHYDHRVYMVLRATGKLTHADYRIITPLIDAELAKLDHPQVRMLVDLTSFEGWEPRAAWDDLKLGLKHKSEFERIAIYGHERWHEWAARIGRWFIAGEFEFFENEKLALDWLANG
jgi:hypothetical protein